MENYSAKPNRLVKEVSPYLLQHSYNPVDWYPWGEDAFRKAKEENKLMIISIGYSSCHWCHVMEQQSFTNDEVAKFMNDNYVCVKVDREERPDIDKIYMNAVQIITRQGGWPLNCFALPDGRPVYGGTYFPKDQWLNVLQSLNETWRNDAERVIGVADELEQGIALSEVISVKSPFNEVNYADVLGSYFEKIKHALDVKYGGTLGAPKFPMPGLLNFLLVFGKHFPNDYALDFVDTTLHRLANGGIFDHVGGGFFRYSVDDVWHVPHFEKMLYDNAQLIQTFSLAYRINPSETYRRAVYKTVRFLQNELKSPKGAFYSALDADSGGNEGAFYTWKKEELDDLLGYDSEIFSAAYGVTPAGNWQGTNVLRYCATDEQLSDIFDMPPQEVCYRLERSLEKLADYRQKRMPPLFDDKIITSWNAMVVSALVDAFFTFNDSAFLEQAEETMDYLMRAHFSDNKLKRIACKGKVYGDALLDDYAFTIEALLKLYSVSKNSKWNEWALQLTQTVISDFWDESVGMFYYTTASNELFVRKMELVDGVIPSATSVMAKNLIVLGMSGENETTFTSISKQIFANILSSLKNGSVYMYSWADFAMYFSLSPMNISFNNDSLPKIVQSIKSKTVYPLLFFKRNEKLEKGSFQICHKSTCALPVNSVDDVVERISKSMIS
ncbi:MAG: thioredoxin domain-containing protein [Bacteroidales bacterium]|nr:thioredoxin domain-containing protein [Bacteroidales bacterium]